ncbi:MAG: DUF5678 domain-containing protein [bacterium]
MDLLRPEIKEILSMLEERGRIKEVVRDHPGINVNIFNIPVAIDTSSPITQEPIDPKMTVLKEKEAYLKMEKELIEKYQGKFVALLNGEVVGVGEDEIELAMRIYKEKGYVPMYIGQVGVKEQVFRVPSPRIKKEVV